MGFPGILPPSFSDSRSVPPDPEFPFFSFGAISFPPVHACGSLFEISCSFPSSFFFPAPLLSRCSFSPSHRTFRGLFLVSKELLHLIASVPFFHRNFCSCTFEFWLNMRLYESRTIGLFLYDVFRVVSTRIIFFFFWVVL